MAELSVVPPSGSTNSRCHTGYALRAVNQSSIVTYGTRSLTLDLGLRRTFRWVFIVADAQHAILGADFLHHFGLSVDVRQSLLLDTVTQLQVHGISTQTISASPSLPSLDSQDPYAAVLAEFPGILPLIPRSSPFDTQSHTTFAPRDPQFPPNHVACPQIACASRSKSSTICWTWASFNRRQVAGPPHYTWSRRSPKVTGALVVITELSTESQNPTAILFPTFRTSLHPFMELQCFPRLTSCIRSTKSLWNPQDSRQHAFWTL